MTNATTDKFSSPPTLGRPKIKRCLVLTALCHAVLPWALNAQSHAGAVSCNPLKPKGRVALVASGGISKGAYQAGVLWGFLQAERAVRHHAPDSALSIEAIAGASAGNVNSLLASVEWSTAIDSSRDERSSLLWKVWTSLGVETLLPSGKQKKEVISALSHTALEPAVDLVEASQGSNLLSCSIGIAVTMTRFDSATIEDVPGLREAAVLRHISTARYSSGATGWRLNDLEKELGLRGAGIQISARSSNGQIDLADFKSHILASAAFPFAFPPQRLSVDRRSGGALSGIFVDGGVFDNEPIDVGEALLRLTGECGQVDTSYDCAVVFAAPNRRRVVAESTLTLVHPSHEHPLRDFAIPASLSRYVGFAGLIKRAAGDAEVAGLGYVMDDSGNTCRNANSDGRVCLIASDRRRAIFGSTAMSFGAFLGQPFREYDFYTGVYDGLCARAQAFQTSRQRGMEGCGTAALGRQINDPAALPELSTDGRHLLRWLHCLEVANGAHPPQCVAAIPEASVHVGSLVRLGTILDSASTAWELLERDEAELKDVRRELATISSGERPRVRVLQIREDSLKKAASRARSKYCPTGSNIVAFFCNGGLYETIRAYSVSYVSLNEEDRRSLNLTTEFARLLRYPEQVLFLYALEVSHRLRMVEEIEPLLSRRVIGGIVEFAMSKQSSQLDGHFWRPFHSENGILFDRPELAASPWNRVILQSIFPLTVTFGADRRRPSELQFAPLGGIFPLGHHVGIGPIVVPRRLLSSDRRIDAGVRVQFALPASLSVNAVGYCPMDDLAIAGFPWNVKSRCWDQSTGQLYLFGLWRTLGVGLEWRAWNTWRDARVFFALDDVTTLLLLYSRAR